MRNNNTGLPGHSGEDIAHQSVAERHPPHLKVEMTLSVLVSALIFLIILPHEMKRDADWYIIAHACLLLFFAVGLFIRGGLCCCGKDKKSQYSSGKVLK